MIISSLLKNIGSVENVILTGVCDPNRCAAVITALSPSEAEAIGTLIDVGSRDLKIPYRFEVQGELSAAKDQSNLDVVYIGNNSQIKNAQSLIDAWLPTLKTGGYLICFDHYAAPDAELIETTTSTTEYPDNWYQIKE